MAGSSTCTLRTYQTLRNCMNTFAWLTVVFQPDGSITCNLVAALFFAFLWHIASHLRTRRRFYGKYASYLRSPQKPLLHSQKRRSVLPPRRPPAAIPGKISWRILPSSDVVSQQRKTERPATSKMRAPLQTRWEVLGPFLGLILMLFKVKRPGQAAFLCTKHLFGREKREFRRAFPCTLPTRSWRRLLRKSIHPLLIWLVVVQTFFYLVEDKPLSENGKVIPLHQSVPPPRFRSPVITIEVILRSLVLKPKNPRGGRISDLPFILASAHY